MPVGALVGAAGSVAGGLIGGKGAKKAAKIQAQSAAQQTALQNNIYNQNAARFNGDISRGEYAADRLQELLGLTPYKVDATAILRNTPGYEFRLGEALRATNANAYGRGLGNSGATQRALLSVGQGMADQTFNNYIAQIGDVVNRSVASKSAIAGVGQNFANASANIAQNAADTASNYQIFKSQNLNSVLGDILRGAGQSNLFGSSYSAPAAPTSGGLTVSSTMPMSGGWVRQF